MCCYCFSTRLWKWSAFIHMDIIIISRWFNGRVYNMLTHEDAIKQTQTWNESSNKQILHTKQPGLNLVNHLHIGVHPLTILLYQMVSYINIYFTFASISTQCVKHKLGTQILTLWLFLNMKTKHAITPLICLLMLYIYTPDSVRFFQANYLHTHTSTELSSMVLYCGNPPWPTDVLN